MHGNTEGVDPEISERAIENHDSRKAKCFSYKIFPKLPAKGLTPPNSNFDWDNLDWSSRHEFHQDDTEAHLRNGTKENHSQTVGFLCTLKSYVKDLSLRDFASCFAWAQKRRGRGLYPGGRISGI